MSAASRAPSLFRDLQKADVSPDLAPFMGGLLDRVEVPRHPSVTEWADRYRVFDRRTSAHPRFDSRLNPAIRAIQDACSEDLVRRVTLRGCRQSGKTTFAENALGTWIADEEARGPVLWIEATKENVRNPLFRARVDSLFTCDTVREHVPTATDDRGAYKIVMSDMIVTFAWAGSQPAQSGQAMRYVILNELGIYSKHSRVDSVNVAGRSTTTFVARGSTKIIATSTPEDEGDQLDLQVKASDLRHFHLPCPHCGGYQILVLSAEHATAEVGVTEMRKGEDAKQPEDVTDANVWFNCRHCGERFDEHHRLWMLARGVWAREGADIPRYEDGDGHHGDTETQSTPNAVDDEAPDSLSASVSQARRSRAGGVRFPSGRSDILEPYTEHVGFHLPAFVSGWRTWPGIMKSFLTAVRSGDVEQLRNVVRFDLAEPWREKGEAPKPEVVKRCIDDYAARSIPAEAQVLGVFLGIDVQELSVFYVARAFGYEWRSWLIDAGEIVRELGKGSDLAPVLDQVVSARYEDFAGDVHGVSFGLIDAQYDTNAVYDYCIRRRGRIAPARGGNRELDPHIKVTKFEPARRRPRTDAPTGEVVMHTINPWKFSEATVHAMRVPKGEYGEWRLPADIEELDPRYMEQVTNQRKGRSSRGVVVWKPIHQDVGDHYHDAEKLARACAMLRGVHKVRRRAPRRNLHAPPPVTKPRGFRREY